MEIGSCGTLDTQELAQLCDFLSTETRKLASLPVITGAAGLLTGVIASLLTTFGTLRNQQKARFNRSQREDLLAAQNIALKLRSRYLAFLEFVRGGLEGENPFPSVEQTRLLGKMQTSIVRIEDETLRKLYKVWSEYALELFSGSPELEELTEEEHWERALLRSGVVLRRLDR